MQTFRSKAHPGDRSVAHVHGQALVRPFAVCMLPVMVVTLVAVLEGERVLPVLGIATVFAFMASSGWVHFQLRRTPALLRVSDGRAAVQSIWETLRGRHAQRSWAPVLDLREHSSGVLATIGHESFAFPRRDWPRHDELVDALKGAFHQSMQATSPTSTSSY